MNGATAWGRPRSWRNSTSRSNPSCSARAESSGKCWWPCWPEGISSWRMFPAWGKTILSRAIAGSVQATFRRVQLTPDLLPSDILGVSVYDADSKKFLFKQGPIFTNLLLADEINRTTPRTQSALLEAMNESQVTADGTTYPLGPLFMVIATQNPLRIRGHVLPAGEPARPLHDANPHRAPGQEDGAEDSAHAAGPDPPGQARTGHDDRGTGLAPGAGRADPLRRGPGGLHPQYRRGHPPKRRVDRRPQPPRIAGVAPGVAGRRPCWPAETTSRPPTSRASRRASVPIG